MHNSRKFFAQLLGFCAASIALMHAETPAHACGWDDEVYEAEERTLPCLTRALSDTFALHTPAYYETRLRAAETALAVDPFSPWALDMAGIALLKLGRYPEAEAKMLARLQAFPDAYPSHANLGTLYTFNGEFDKGLRHIDRAMAIEPSAHFGREKYHRLLVVYLKDAQEHPQAAAQKNFLNVELGSDLGHGSPAKFDTKMAAAGLGRDVFDALDSMITVYGAHNSPCVYAAAGDMLALFGKPLYAAIAYAMAIKKHHPHARVLAARSKTLTASMHLRGDGSDTPTDPHVTAHTPDDYLFILTHPELNPGAEDLRAEYTSFEAKQLTSGLAVWTADGIAKLYAEQARRKGRCAVGHLVTDLEAPPKLPLLDAGPSASPTDAAQ
jgi:tetratricopeptide (TPR) repeat protein